MSFINPESATFFRLTKMTNIMILNILWIVCSLPIITIGSSTIALYYSMMKIVREEDGGMTEMFFRSFKLNFRQGCYLTMFMILAALFFLIDFGLIQYVNGVYKTALILVVAFVMAECFLVFSYSFALIARFDNTIMQTFKNALFLGISNPLFSIIVLLLNAIPFILLLFMPNTFIITIPIWIVFGVAMIAYINSKIFIRVFDRFSHT